MTNVLAASVFAAEQRRCAAMIANNASELDAVLDPRLHFAHATGAIDRKPEYLFKMAAGRIIYHRIDWSEEVVTELAHDVAMLTGRMATAVSVEGTDKHLTNRVISIWGRSGDQWRMIAFQSTPLAG